MADIEVLEVKRRDQTGKRRNRRLRKAGAIPAVLYGHGQDCVSLAVPAKQIETAIRHGSRLVDLQGDLSESALIRDVQWDVWGVDVLHIDFTRVDKDERVEVTVPVETRGEAPGVKAGGVLTQSLHEIQMECAAMNIPESIEVSINSLDLGQTITAGDLEIPPNATLITPADSPVVAIVEAQEQQPEDEEAAVGGVEPEVIGKSAEEGGESDES